VGRGLDLGEQFLGALPAASRAMKSGWLKMARSALVRSLSGFSRASWADLASWAAPASSTLVAGSSRPEEASSSATELRRTSAASRANLAASSRACSRSSRPARQEMYTPTQATTAMTMMLVIGVIAGLPVVR
jgi:hypothetical protein